MPEPDFKQKLLTIRIIWAAMLMGQIMFLAVTLFVAPPPQAQSTLPQMLFYVAVGMLAVMVPTAYFVRSIVYRAGRRDGVLTASAYVTGNIIFYAMCEGVGMFAIVGAFLNGGRGPHLFVAAAAMAVQILNFPSGATVGTDSLGRAVAEKDLR